MTARRADYCMAFCPNCGEQVREEHHYCCACGYPLAEVGEDEGRVPPSGTAASRQGFLSGRSSEYLTSVLNGEQELDSGAVGYSNVSRDVGAGLADFAMVAAIENLNLLALAIDSTSDSSVLGKNEERLSREEVRERLMWMGLLRLPELYDRAFATAWADELSEELETLSENVETPRTE